jgi:hypothetical protein
MVTERMSGGGRDTNLCGTQRGRGMGRRRIEWKEKRRKERSERRKSRGGRV